MTDSYNRFEVFRSKSDSYGSNEIKERKVEIDKSIKLTKSEKKAYIKHLYDCNDEEKIERRNALNKIQDHESKKRFYNKNNKKVKRKIQVTNNILESNDKGSKLSSVSRLTKYKESRKKFNFSKNSSEQIISIINNFN